MSFPALIKGEVERFTIGSPQDIRRIAIDGFGEYADVLG